MVTAPSSSRSSPNESARMERNVCSVRSGLPQLRVSGNCYVKRTFDPTASWTNIEQIIDRFTGSGRSSCPRGQNSALLAPKCLLSVALNWHSASLLTPSSSLIRLLTTSSRLSAVCGNAKLYLGQQQIVPLIPLRKRFKCLAIEANQIPLIIASCKMPYG